MLLVHESGIVLDSSPARLDLDAIERWLSAESYWALGRPRTAIENSIANSLVYGLYLPVAESSAAPGEPATGSAGSDAAESSAVRPSASGSAPAGPSAAQSPAGSPAARSPAARSPAARSPAARSPAAGFAARGEQIGFFRLVSDKTTFAWLCDVFVDAAYRGRGLAQWALARIRDEILAMGVHRILLATADAHAVYERLGFKPLAEPGRWMELTTRRIEAP